MADYYVSSSGNDANSGVVTAPFRTVVKGLQTTAAGDRLILREGTYLENSGWFPGNATAVSPISVEAYSGEKVTISALSAITNWEPFDLTNGRAIYRAQMPFTMCGTNTAIAGEDFITCNGVPVNEAQWPAANPSQYPQTATSWATVEGGTWITSPSTVDAPVTVQIQDSALTVFPSNALVGSRITLLPGARWTLVSGTVSGNLEDKLTFVIKSPGGESFYAPDSRSLYFLFGKKTFLSSPGSWWRDPDTNYLYLWLLDSSNPNQSTIKAKKDSILIDFYARSHYRLKNLNFEGACLNIYQASDMRIENCTFKWYSHRLYHDRIWGWTVPALYVNTNNVVVQDCDFVDAVGNIIAIEQQQGLTIKNCVVANTGGLVFGGVDSKFLQNTVSNCPGGCFKLTGDTTRTEVAYNDFSQGGRTFTDGGLVLVEHHCVGGGGRIHRNFLHDGFGLADGTKEFYGTAGFYFESDVSDLILDHNIVCRTTSPTINLVGGSGKEIKNVKFYNNTCDGSLYWIPTWAGEPTYPKVGFINNYFASQAANTGQHPDLQFTKNAFKILPSFLNATSNVAVPNPLLDVDYFPEPNSPLRSIAQTISGITTDPFPDIGAREGVRWKVGATVRSTDIKLLTVTSYRVEGNSISFVIGNLPLGRRLGDNFKMKLGSGNEAAGTISPYSASLGQTIWARIDASNWLAIGQIELPPVLSALNSGAGLPGSVIALLGSNFQTDSSVVFGNAEIAAVYINAGRLEISVPNVTAPTTLPLKIVNADGQQSGILNYSVLSSLSLTSSSVAVVSPGQQIQFAGTGFIAGAIARFGEDTEIGTEFSSSSLIGVQIPVLPAGAVSVKILNPDGAESGALQLTVILIPSIASFTPNPIQPGEPLIIVGENFGADPYVTIGGVEVIPTNYTGNSLTLTIPVSTLAGTVQARVVSEVGPSAPISLIVLRPPVLTAVLPTSAPVGTRILLTGANLVVGSQILFGDTVGQASAFSGTAASVVVPTLPLGTVAIRVVSPQNVVSDAIFFEVLPAPTILSVFPKEAVAGSEIAVVGENFLAAIQVFLGTSEILSGVTRLSEAQLSVIVPQLPPGNYSLRVENLDGGRSNDLDFLIQGKPAVSAISKTRGLPGTDITVTGSNFELGAAVKFGTASVQTNFLGANTLSFTVPTTSPGTVNLSVRNPTDLESSAIAFEVLAVPTIDFVSPNAASVGTEISITGAHFKSDAQVYLNGAPIATTIINASTLKIVVPNHGFGTFALKVVNVADELTSLQEDFTVLRKPIVLSIAPASAQPGATVKVFGVDFEEPTLLLNGSQIAYTSINGGLSFVLPQFQPSTLSIRIRNKSNSLSEPTALTVLPAIALYSVTPPTSAPKTTVSLQGAFFPPDARVFFGIVEAQVISIASDRITVQVPNLSAIPTTLKVVTPAGAISTSILPFDVLPSLTISHVTPNPAPSGTLVEIRGSGFNEGITVFVRNVRAIDLIRVSDTLLKMTVPPLVPGPAQLKLVLPDDRQTFFDFTVPSVWISGVSHTVVRVGEWLEITGTGFVQPLAVTVGGVAVTEIVVVSPNLIKVRVPPFLLNEI